MVSLYPSIQGGCYTLCDNGKDGGNDGRVVSRCCSVVGSVMIKRIYDLLYH